MLNVDCQNLKNTAKSDPYSKFCYDDAICWPLQSLTTPTFLTSLCMYVRGRNHGHYEPLLCACVTTKCPFTTLEVHVMTVGGPGWGQALDQPCGRRAWWDKLRVKLTLGWCCVNGRGSTLFQKKAASVDRESLSMISTFHSNLPKFPVRRCDGCAPADKDRYLKTAAT